MHDTLLSIACRHSLVSSVVHFGFAKECDKEDEGDKVREQENIFCSSKNRFGRRDGFLQRSPGLTFAITNVSKEAKLFVFVLFTFAKYNTLLQTIHFCPKIQLKIQSKVESNSYKKN